MNNNPQTPLSRLLNTTNNNNNNNSSSSGNRQLNTEEMLESLIQELGIEKLDHLPELIDLFENDSVFSATPASNLTASPAINPSSANSDSKMKQSLINSNTSRTPANPIGQKC